MTKETDWTQMVICVRHDGGCTVFEFECRLEAEDVMGDLNPYQVIPRDLTNNPGRQKTSSRYTK